MEILTLYIRSTTKANTVKASGEIEVTELHSKSAAIQALSGDSLPEAPVDGKQYARQDKEWTEVVAGGIDLSSYATTEYVDTAIGDKVDKAPGMGLSEENFTTTLKDHLNSLSNYNDSAIQASVAAMRQQLDLLLQSAGGALRFSVDIPEGVDPTTINLSIAPLKYDKHFAFTYTADDSVVGAYARIWRRINRKWIDDREFFHKGDTPTTGYIPEQPLVMTDGCGNDRRFGFSCAIWPTFGNEYSPDGFIRESATGTNSIYVAWDELRQMIDYGVSLCFHNVDERRYDKTDPLQVAAGFIDDDAKAFIKTGRHLKVLGQPDGNKAYIEAATQSPLVAFTRSSTDGVSNKIQLATTGPLYKQITYGGSNTSDIQAKLAELAAQHASNTPYWVGITSHRVSIEMLQMLETVYNLYGKGGDDTIWMASWDEVYEYIAMREGVKISRVINGRTVTFELTMPTDRAFYFSEISLLMSGITSIEGVNVTPLSDGIKGLVYAPHKRYGDVGHTGLLLNLNFNAQAEALAEKYTALYETSKKDADKEDAQYFTSMLRPVLAAPFLARIEAATPEQPEAPVLVSVIINDGQAETSDPTLNVQLEAMGEPSHYRISEDEAFTDTEWLPFASSVPFVLSAGAGQKTLYAQVRNATGESNIQAAQITLTDTSTRAILSFGWDWTAGQYGKTNYDPVLRVGKVRLNVIVDYYDIFDMNGVIIGTAAIDWLVEGGQYFQGAMTGDGSGIYADQLLKFNCIKKSDFPTASIGIKLNMSGRYRFRIFINTTSPINITKSSYSLEHEQAVYNFPTEDYVIKDNFSQTIEQVVDVNADEIVYMRMTTDDQANLSLPLNVLDIEKI